jgi:hypothetical protein
MPLDLPPIPDPPASSGRRTAAVPLGPWPAPAAETPLLCISGFVDDAGAFQATDAVFIRQTGGGPVGLRCPFDTPRPWPVTLDAADLDVCPVADGPEGVATPVPVVKLAAGSAVPTDALDWPLACDRFLPGDVLPVTARLDVKLADTATPENMTGLVQVVLDVDWPILGRSIGPVRVGFAGNSIDTAHLKRLAFDANGGFTVATADLTKLRELLALVPLPLPPDMTLTVTPDEGSYAASLSGSVADPEIPLVPALVGLKLTGTCRLGFDTRTGLQLTLPDGVASLSKGVLSADLFSQVPGVEKYISPPYEAAGNTKLFSLSGENITLDDGAALVTWDGAIPSINADLMRALTKIEVNANRILGSFAGDLLADVGQCLTRFQKAAGEVAAWEPVRQGWKVTVPLVLAVQRRDQTPVFSATGRFGFIVGVDASADPPRFRLGAGSFTVEPEVVLEVTNDQHFNASGLVSLHIPKSTTYVFRTDPTSPRVAIDAARTSAKTSRRTLLRVPGDKEIAEADWNKPGTARFTFELEKFALSPRGLDLKGGVRVEQVKLNESHGESDTETGLKQPLEVQKPDEESKDKKDDTEAAAVGTIEFRNSRLICGSLRAGFQLRYFDDARGTITVIITEDPASKRLAVAGTVEINRPVEYRVDALFTLFKLKSIRLTLAALINGSDVTWKGNGDITGAVRFQPPPGSSASGPLAELFSGVTCEFEHLNPVTLGRGAALTFTFPPKTFSIGGVLEVDLAGIRVEPEDRVGKGFELLGEVRVQNLPGVDASLTFGGIEMRVGDGRSLPKISVRRIGAAITIPGGIKVAAYLDEIKDEDEVGYAGAMTLESEALPPLAGLIKLTRVRCPDDRRWVPSLALYLEADYEAPLVFGFYLRALGAGVGINQSLRGLGGKAAEQPLEQRIMRFVDDPRGLPNPRRADGWEADPPKRASDAPHWMLVGRALITFGNLPMDKPHLVAGNILVALDHRLRVTAGVNLWLFTSPGETRQPAFEQRPAARGALQLAPREGKVFGYFRSLPAPRFGAGAPEMLSKLFENVQTSLMFLADRNGFLVEVGWPWETRANPPLPAPLRGVVTTGYRYGVYRGVVCIGLNYGVEVGLDAEAGVNFKTPLGSAGAKLSVRGAGYFRASFVGALDTAFNPYLLGDVRVAATVSLRAEAHVELSKKITRWFKLRLRIRFSASFQIAISAALRASFSPAGIGFTGDASVSVCVSGYRLSGQVPFQCNPKRVDAVDNRLKEILPAPIIPAPAVVGGGQEVAPTPPRAPEWQYRVRRVGNKFVVALLPAPGCEYPGIDGDPASTGPAPTAARFKLKLKRPELFRGFLGQPVRPAPTGAGVLEWAEELDAVLVSVEEMRQSDDEQVQSAGTSETDTPLPLTLNRLLIGTGRNAPTGSSGLAGSDVVDERTRHPSADANDDQTSSVAPPGSHSPNFKRDQPYDQNVANAHKHEPPPELSGDEIEGVAGLPPELLAAEVVQLLNAALPRHVDSAGTDSASRFGLPQTFAATRLKLLLVFDAHESIISKDPVQDLLNLFDSATNAPVEDAFIAPVRAADAGDHRWETKTVPLKSVTAGLDPLGEYDLIPGRVFQSEAEVALCWDFRLEKQGEDAFAAYKFGFEFFRVTRLNVSDAQLTQRSEVVYPCWLEAAGGSLVRPQFQYVDRLESGRRDTGGTSRPVLEGDLLTYRVEAVGQEGRVLTAARFQFARRTVRPLHAPGFALALHTPKASPAAGHVRDAGKVTITVSAPDDGQPRDSAEAPAFPSDRLMVRFRLVKSGMEGPYGFDASPPVETRTVFALPSPTSKVINNSAVAEVKFAESTASRPLPWEETLALRPTWAEHPLPLLVAEKANPEIEEDGPQEDRKLKVFTWSPTVKALREQVEAALQRPWPSDHALELWVGQADPRPDSSRPFERSPLTALRHAVDWPTPEPVPAPATDHLTPAFFRQGNTVAALEMLPDYETVFPAEKRFVRPDRISSLVDYGSFGGDPDKTRDDVSLRLAWRTPVEPRAAFNPVVSCTVRRADRYHPTLYRAGKTGVTLPDDVAARVVPDSLYRATPPTIELQAVRDTPDVPGAPAPGYRGDWVYIDSFEAWGPIDDRPAPANSDFAKVFVDDRDRPGLTFILASIAAAAEDMARVMEALTPDVDKKIKPILCVREPFEDRVDAGALGDYVNNALQAEKRLARLQKALSEFQTKHSAQSDPYGWATAEALGLSVECTFCFEGSTEPVPLDAWIRERPDFLKNLKSKWDERKKPPVAVVLFLADDGVTHLNVTRFLYVGRRVDNRTVFPKWGEETADFRIHQVADVKLLGNDPKAMPESRWTYLNSAIAGFKALVDGWMADIENRLKNAGLADQQGTLAVFRRALPERTTEDGKPLSVPPRVLPIGRDGLVRVDLPVSDRTAHVYDMAVETERRYDRLWAALQPQIQDRVVPFSRLHPVRVERTRALVPHNVLATPLPGSVQAYVFAHPAEFASTASAVNAVAIQYSGQSVFLERRIADPKRRKRILDVLNNWKESFNIDWNRYETEYARPLEQRELAAADVSLACGLPGRGRPDRPDDVSRAFEPVFGTESGLYGVDRYVYPDLPGYYEYRVSVLSTAGLAQSPLAATPFVAPLYDEPLVERPPLAPDDLADGEAPQLPPPTVRLPRQRPAADTGADSLAAITSAYDASGRILTLRIRLAHPRLHMRSQLRGLWVDADESLAELVGGENPPALRYGSLPDLALAYELYFNVNASPNEPPPPSVLVPIVVIEPPSMADDDVRTLFRAKSSDPTRVQVGEVGGGGVAWHDEADLRVVAPDAGGYELQLDLRLQFVQSATTPNDYLPKLKIAADGGRLHTLFEVAVVRRGARSEFRKLVPPLAPE